MLFPTIAALSIFVASLSMLTANLRHFYLLYLLITLFGPSPVLYSAVLVRLFDRRLGLALGLMMVGVGLGSTIVPLSAQLLIAAYGWRMAYAIIGMATLTIGIPAALIAGLSGFTALLARAGCWIA